MSRIFFTLTAVLLATAAPVLAVTTIPPVAGPHLVPVDVAMTDAARPSAPPEDRSAEAAEIAEIAAAMAGLLIVFIVFAASRPPRSFSD